MKYKEKEDKLNKIYQDIKYSNEKFSKLFKEVKEDFEFVQGKQWDEADVNSLRSAGVDALTINKLKPIIKLITGIERQSKSDFVAFPEGGEDSLPAEIVTRLLKNVTKTSQAEQKLSEQFKHGAICGGCFLEPFIDYSYDIINGEMKFKKVSIINVLWDPDAKEYDLSDSRFMMKFSLGLSRDQVLMLFPDKEKVIDSMSDGFKFPFDNMNQYSESREEFGYPRNSGQQLDGDNPVATYDLCDYYYRELEDKFFVADRKTGMIEEKSSKDEAEQIASQIPGSVIIKRKVPVIKICQIIGNEIMYEGDSWTYPSWKSYPLIPFFSEWITEELGNKSYNIQGIIRSVKSLQREFNKRRTQELRHLNSSANSGFVIDENGLNADEEEKLKRFGSSPGIVVKKKPNAGFERISPMPLSQGHAQLAEENTQDLKEASGVNPDLLANDSMSQSGRAILLKQRQGLVMQQEMLDNFSFTKKMVGKFILSQIKELFTVESAMKVLGDQFISENFTVPVTLVLHRAQQKIMSGKENEITQLEQNTLLQYPGNSPENPAVDPLTNQPIMMVDTDDAQVTINQILSDPDIGKYDVSIGEGPFNETIKMMNFIEITDLAKQGIPIPPTVLIKLSSIPESEKKEIINQLQMIQMAQAAQQANPKEQNAQDVSQ